MSTPMQELLEYTKSTRLLYVEDNEEARRFTLELLSRFFDDIIIAQNGQEGLDLFKNEKFNLVITDINMPIVDGLTMSAIIKEIDNQMPIIALSAHNEKNFIASADEIDIDEYLTKPLELSKLITTLTLVSKKHKDKTQ
ncbi:response regulator [Sulfurimonas aquatica]|uniref:Response regulator n=1 Tax=Sulfurimonas aquatica TaxID=2672570 RepID=A0A975B0S9_9BACT|nr:response regulator [Sulfurimonas aquatica]QSZ42030.1 response regulator [Sulfurimonas aquatica]